MMEEMIEQYLEHHFEPGPNDDFMMEPDQDASFRRRVPGLSVRNSNPPASAGGCLVMACDVPEFLPSDRRPALQKCLVRKTNEHS